MPSLRSSLPTQYTGLDGVSPQADDPGAHHRGTRLSIYVGGGNTSRYSQVEFGFGQRSDFTSQNIKDKGEAKYDFERFGSIKQQLESNKKKSTKKNSTFFSHHSQYEKAVVPTDLKHYFGRGNPN